MATSTMKATAEIIGSTSVSTGTYRIMSFDRPNSAAIITATQTTEIITATTTLAIFLVFILHSLLSECFFRNIENLKQRLEAFPDNDLRNYG